MNQIVGNRAPYPGYLDRPCRGSSPARAAAQLQPSGTRRIAESREYTNANPNTAIRIV